MSDATAIETHGPSKTYRSVLVHALVGLVLRVVRNEVFGYLGPNGAGKSTTIRPLLGLILRPQGARPCSLGLDMQRDGAPPAR